jgi:chaperonin GroES
MDLEALGNRILVRKLPETEERIGGIIIPMTRQQKSCVVCEVVHVGPGSRNGNGERMPIDLTAGDRVFVSRFAMEDIEIGGETICIALEQDILARINPADARDTKSTKLRAAKS